MNFPDPLIKGTLVKRYKRFLSDIVLESGEEITAHCANSGTMLSVNDPGSEVWVSPARNPDRKLKFTWELIRVGKSLVGINTALPNKIVQEAIEAGTVPELQGYAMLRREVKYGKNSRIDILLEDAAKPPCYVEIKSVTMRRDKVAEFPDAVTARGTKHLGELADQVKVGSRAVMFYLIQREDCETFTLADDIDPAYAEALTVARKAGVEVLAYKCSLTPEEIKVVAPIALEL
ncbi:MAG: DNA/RNA nuclease SfsA [Rhodospirillaceae bacterium]